VKYFVYSLVIEITIDNGEKTDYSVCIGNKEDRLKSGLLTKNKLYGNMENQGVENAFEILDDTLNDIITRKTKEKIVSHDILDHSMTNEREILIATLITSKK